VRHEDGKLGCHPLPEVVELEGEPLHHLARGLPATDRGDHSILLEVVVRLDEPIESGDVFVDGHRGLARRRADGAELPAPWGPARFWSSRRAGVKGRKTILVSAADCATLRSASNTEEGVAMMPNCSLSPLKPLDPAVDPAYADGPPPP